MFVDKFRHKNRYIFRKLARYYKQKYNKNLQAALTA